MTMLLTQFPKTRTNTWTKLTLSYVRIGTNVKVYEGRSMVQPTLEYLANVTRRRSDKSDIHTDLDALFTMLDHLIPVTSYMAAFLHDAQRDR